MFNKHDLKIGNKVIFTDCKYNKQQGIVGAIGIVEDFQYATTLVISTPSKEADQPKRYFSIASGIEVELYLEH